MHHKLVNIQVKRERETETEREACFQKCIFELFEILTCSGGYKDLCLHIIRYLGVSAILESNKIVTT